MYRVPRCRSICDASRMPKLERERVVDQHIVGLKFFDQLGSLLEQLQDVGGERDQRFTMEHTARSSPAC